MPNSMALRNTMLYGKVKKVPTAKAKSKFWATKNKGKLTAVPTKIC